MNKILLFILFLSACASPTAPANNNKLSATPVKTAVEQPKLPENRTLIEKEIVARIAEYYRNEYKDAVMSTSESDTLTEITFYGVPEGGDVKDSVFLLVASISKLKTDYIYGDLDNDGKEEIVCSVLTEGGGAGGNIWWNDLFVFRKEDNKYQLLTTTVSPAVCGCDGNDETGGDFYPEKIENGIIAGKSVCWAEGDGHCCPSLNFKARVKLEKGVLVFLDREKINAKGSGD